MSKEFSSFQGEGTLGSSTKPTFSSDVVIPRPATLAGKCPIESESKHFPTISPPCRKKQNKPSSHSSSDSLEFWLKPGISLPKLHSKDVTEEKPDEKSDSISGLGFQSLPPVQGSETSKTEPSIEYVKFPDAKSECVEVPDNVVGPSTCEFLFKVPSCEFDLSKCQMEDEPIEESHALVNWKKWNKVHKKQAYFLSKKLQKKPQELLVQQTEGYRKNLEDKIILGMWNYPETDKWRGHPSRWTLPFESRRSKKPTKERSATPRYFLEKTSLQKGVVQDLEFIVTPYVVKKEKQLSAQSVNYLLIRPNLRISDAAATAESRIRSFLKSRNRLRPHTDIINGLAVVGSQIPQEPQKKTEHPTIPSDLPMIEITLPEHCYYPKDHRNSVFSLVVNGKEISYEFEHNIPQNPDATNLDYQWEFAFGLNCIGDRVQKILEIENRGTIAVRYEWVEKKSDRSKPTNKLTRKRHEPCFYFNKNSGIFLPGQFYYIDFYFHAEVSGARTETWFLKTSPPLGRNVDYATFIFSGVATYDCMEFRSCVLELYLRDRLRDSIVKFIWKVLLQRVFNTTESLKELEYHSMFSERELFEFQNPNYHYHSDLVEDLNTIFQSIATKKHKHWDFSIDSLKKLIETSPKVVNQGFLLCEISEIAKKLRKPNYVYAREGQRYGMAYSILCKMANFMEEDHNYLRKALSNKKPDLRQRINWDFGEYEDMSFGMCSFSESKDDLDSAAMLEIKPINFLYFQTMFYLKVYNRLGEALENIAAMLETRKRFEKSDGMEYKKTLHCIKGEKIYEFPIHP